MSETKLLELIQHSGIVISAGTLSHLLTDGRASFTDEAREVFSTSRSAPSPPA